jgi:hypothetical protein
MATSRHFLHGYTGQEHGAVVLLEQFSENATRMKAGGKAVIDDWHH